jgi:hypothetical protein
MASKLLRFIAVILTSNLLALPIPASSQVEWIGDTRTQVEAKLSLAHQPPTGQALTILARQMLGRPYSAFSLDAEPTERLRLDLTRFDCVLLVEQLLALIHSRTTDDFPKQVMRLRYANAEPDYCQRNHYFSIWANHAETQGVLKDITFSLPGASTRIRKLSFMSSHPKSYRPMKQERSRRCIIKLEQYLSVKQTFVVLSSLSAATPKLKSGDIFALVTSIDGLDVTHTGIIERTTADLNAIHAIPNHGVVRTKDFVKYAYSVEDVVGVSIYRPLPPLHLKQ